MALYQHKLLHPGQRGGELAQTPFDILNVTAAQL
jgi:hypothetical protein